MDAPEIDSTSPPDKHLQLMVEGTEGGEAGSKDQFTNPDHSEEALAEDLDNVIPSRGYQMTPMVGVGGSAGSIPVLQQFLRKLPVDSGMVFVVVLHLSPDFESNLAQILQKETAMRVLTAMDGQKVEVNSVYVIPPGKYISSVDGYLRLSELQLQKGRRMAVDIFFRTLADTHGPHSIAITLSGGDGDGAIGIKRIKERGGLTICQDPDEAEHPGMPRAAIATGMVDWVLRVEEMPDRLVGYIGRERRLRLPPEEGPESATAPKISASEAELAFRDVLGYLRTRTGRDFSYYKRATVLRRISRRMQVNGIDALPEYLGYLRTHPGEAGALLQDLLISVTNFFRDRECFEALEAKIPELFKGKGPNDTLRVWVAACATGEEAYSIAIMLCEHARKLDNPPIIQVFATDLDEEVIQMARNGIYPETIATDVSEDRLRRFFVKEHRGYRLRREVREVVLFALHDVLKDSPFSRLDLVSCRNLMIYLNREAQGRMLEIFHFALRSEGRLFLGASESVEDGSNLFEVLDKKHRLYARRSNARIGLPLAVGPSTLARALEERERSTERPSIAGAAGHPHASTPLLARREVLAEPRSSSWAEIHYKLIEQLAAPSILVNQEHEIIHISENAGRFLQISGGELTRNLLRCVHPMVRIELRAALYRASQAGIPSETRNIPISLEGTQKYVTIRVKPTEGASPDLMLVLFELGENSSEMPLSETTPSGSDQVARQLERELEGMKSHLRDVVEQYEASTEELKASNEELQAMNEELRSATEELETSREELQSINEELTTVNQELKSKVDELGHANSDLRNLIGATDIATVFLDRDFRITRYTPPAVALFKFIPTDIGRPLTDLKHHLEYRDLEPDAIHVLETLTPSEREVRDADENWYIARMLPYRTVDERIAGVVLTLLNITERKSAEELLRSSEERLRLVIESAREYAIFTTDLNRQVTSWNSGAQRILGYHESEILGQSADLIFTAEDRAAGIPERETRRAITEQRALDERWHERKDGSRFWASGVLMAMHDASAEPMGLVKIFRDETEARASKQALEESRREAEEANRAKDYFLAILSHELRTPLTPIAMAAQMVASESSLSPDAADSLEMIQRNIRIETALIDDLLDVTRIKQGRLELDVTTVDVHECLRKAVEICRSGIEKGKHNLILRLDARRHSLQGDSTRLQQAFWNLLQNACKFTPKTGHIGITSYDRGDRIVIKIMDDGIGIASDALPKLFEPFTQADPTVAKRYGGLGLGLTIVRATIAAHGGTIHAESDGLNKGTTMVIELPLTDAPTKEQAK
jgi:two-component system CheB/CheR fusion protein